MDKQLAQFLDHIIKPESAEDIKHYVKDKIIFEKGLTLCCNYCAGTASIIGTVNGQPINIMYNHFYYPEGFIFKIDNQQCFPPVSLEELKRFFTANDVVKEP